MVHRGWIQETVTRVGATDLVMQVVPSLSTSPTSVTMADQVSNADMLTVSNGSLAEMSGRRVHAGVSAMNGDYVPPRRIERRKRDLAIVGCVDGVAEIAILIDPRVPGLISVRSTVIDAQALVWTEKVLRRIRRDHVVVPAIHRAIAIQVVRIARAATAPTTAAASTGIAFGPAASRVVGAIVKR